MPSQLTTDEQALRLFFTDDFYLVDEPGVLKDSRPQPELKPGLPEGPVSPVEPVSAEARPEILKSAAPVFKFLGNNKRNILILVNDPENEVSDEKGRELLRKIVKSVNLTANDFALLNYANYTDVEALLGAVSLQTFKNNINPTVSAINSFLTPLKQTPDLKNPR